MTTKKTTNDNRKAAAKKTPVAKAGMTKSAFRADYKVGARVKVTRRTGEIANGLVLGIKQTPTGPFVCINIGTKKEPQEVQARPARVKSRH